MWQEHRRFLKVAVTVSVVGMLLEYVLLSLSTAAPGDWTRLLSSAPLAALLGTFFLVAWFRVCLQPVDGTNGSSKRSAKNLWVRSSWLVGWRYVRFFFFQNAIFLAIGAHIYVAYEIYHGLTGLLDDWNSTGQPERASIVEAIKKILVVAIGLYGLYAAKWTYLRLGLVLPAVAMDQNDAGLRKAMRVSRPIVRKLVGSYTLLALSIPISVAAILAIITLITDALQSIQIEYIAMFYNIVFMLLHVILAGDVWVLVSYFILQINFYFVIALFANVLVIGYVGVWGAGSNPTQPAIRFLMAVRSPVQPG